MDRNRATGEPHGRSRGGRAAEIAAQREEIGALEREGRELRGQLGAIQFALRDVTFQRDSSDAAFAAAEARRLDLETQADRNRMTIATLQTRVSTLEVRLADGERAAASAATSGETERARLAAALADRAGVADRLGADLDAAMAQGARLAADLAATRARLGEAEAALSRSETAREEALLESGRQFARIAERDAALREVEAAKRDFADQLSRVAAAHAIAEGALRRANGPSCSAKSTRCGPAPPRPRPAAARRAIRRFATPSRAWGATWRD